MSLGARHGASSFEDRQHGAAGRGHPSYRLRDPSRPDQKYAHFLLHASSEFGLKVADQENPHNPSHPPLYSTSNRITFRPIDLWLKADAQTREQQKAPQHQKHYAQVPEEEAGRSMFLQRPAKNGPNRPTVFPGRQRDRVRAEKRAQKEGAQGSQEGTPVGEEDDDGKDEGVDADMSTPAPDVNDMDIDPALMDLNQAGRVTPAHGEAESAWAQSSASPMRGLTPTNHHEAEQMEMQMQGDMFSTPGAGPSTPALPSLDTVPDLHSTMFATGPRRGGHRNKTGRPRTRPVLEVHSADQIGSVNLGLLPDNVRSGSSVSTGRGSGAEPF